MRLAYQSRIMLFVGASAALALTLGAGKAAEPTRTDSKVAQAEILVNTPIRLNESGNEQEKKKPAGEEANQAGRTTQTRTAPAATTGAPPDLMTMNPQEVVKSVSTVGLFALVSLAPAAVLMMTAFVRINIVLVLLRQALGSPQVPGNQVLTALALLLTALVMRPTGELVYQRAIAPYAKGEVGWQQAYEAGSVPVKAFMMEQIKRTNHGDYLWAIHDETAAPGAVDPAFDDEFSIGTVATAYLLSELTTALVIGFYLYLPFLVVDLVVSAVLAAMGLFMLPPSLVSLPLKLILFVLANGWLHVATMLLQSFGPVGGT